MFKRKEPIDWAKENKEAFERKQNYWDSMISIYKVVYTSGNQVSTTRLCNKVQLKFIFDTFDVINVEFLWYMLDDDIATQSTKELFYNQK